MGGRIYSVDAMRIVAVVFVVLIHTDPFQGMGATGNAVNFGIKTVSRFAVPFFFLAAGYFFAQRTERENPTGYLRKRLVNLVSLYAFGLAVSGPAFLIKNVVSKSLSGRSAANAVAETTASFLDPVELLYYGTSVSEILWFIPALAFSFALVYLFVVVDRPGALLPVATAFHVVGLLGTNYTMFLDVPFEVRDALFFGFFYTSLGYVIWSRNWESAAPNGRVLATLTGVLSLLQLVEFYVLGYPLQGSAFGSYVYAPSFGISTVLLTVTLFLYLLSRPRLGAGTPLPSWGRYAVGIYVTHPAVFAILRWTREGIVGMGYAIDSTIAWHLFLTPATLFGALAVYLLAHELRVIEIGGSHFPGAPLIRSSR